MMRRNRWSNGSVLRTCGVIAATVVISNALMAQTLTWLGTFGGAWSFAHGVSDDGSVVGESENARWELRAFRWTAAGGMQDLGTFPDGHHSTAYGISADGRVVVGWAAHGNGMERAVRWENGVMQDLGTLGGNESSARGISADGSVIVGVAYNTSGLLHAFRWDSVNGMQDLGTLGGNESYSYGASADGSVIVGWAENASGQWRAFRWTQGGGMEDLGAPRGGESGANKVSADGSVVVGWTRNISGQLRAVRWENGVMQDLGTLGGNRSEAWDVSADGSVVVGGAENASGQWRAFRWTQGGGMEDLETTYATLLTDGSRLGEARAISPNGRFIIGIGENATTGRVEGWLLDTVPEPASLVMLSAGLIGLLARRRYPR